MTYAFKFTKIYLSFPVKLVKQFFFSGGQIGSAVSATVFFKNASILVGKKYEVCMYNIYHSDKFHCVTLRNEYFIDF